MEMLLVCEMEMCADKAPPLTGDPNADGICPGFDQNGSGLQNCRAITGEWQPTVVSGSCFYICLSNTVLKQGTMALSVDLRCVAGQYEFAALVLTGGNTGNYQPLVLASGDYVFCAELV